MSIERGTAADTDDATQPAEATESILLANNDTTSDARHVDSDFEGTLAPHIESTAAAAAEAFNLTEHGISEPEDPTDPSTDDWDLPSCIACGGNGLSGILRMRCGHLYCEQCIVRLFESALGDESLFPPRCCGQHISFELIEHLCSEECEAMFDDRRIELTAENRVYCARPECSIFIRSDRIKGGVAVCRLCSTETCVYCKGTAHNGECPQDPAVTSLMALAAVEGYKQCYRCHAMVELTFGCNHIM